MFPLPREIWIFAQGKIVFNYNLLKKVELISRPKIAPEFFQQACARLITVYFRILLFFF